MPLTVRRILPRHLALVTAVLALTSVTLAPPASAEGTAPIVLRGEGSTFTDVSFTSPVELAEVVTFARQGSTDVGSSSGGTYVGYYVLSLPALQPVAGAVEIEAFSAQLGRPATTRIGPDTRRLEPGRYRFVLLADGAGEARIGTTSLAQPLELDLTTPHPTAGAQVVSVTNTGEAPTRGPVADFRHERDGVYLLAFQTRSSSPVTSTEYCVVRRDAGGCEPDSGARPGASGGSTVAIPVDGQDLKPGVYRTEWDLVGDQSVQYLALSVGPGPRSPAVLPTPQQPTTRDDTTSRARNLLDVCPEGTAPPAFDDTTGTTHQPAVDCLAALGVARGSDGRYGPTAPVSRGQLASFLHRSLVRAGVPMPTAGGPRFSDTADSVHRDAISAVAALGVAQGYRDGTFRPDQPVPRDQAATFLHRAYATSAGLPLDRTTDAFTDDAGNAHETSIDALAANGIVRGLDPVRYDPRAVVSRGQMATMVAGTLDLLAEVGRLQPLR
jgi:hypothetical protein